MYNDLDEFFVISPGLANAGVKLPDVVDIVESEALATKQAKCVGTISSRALNFGPPEIVFDREREDGPLVIQSFRNASDRIGVREGDTKYFAKYDRVDITSVRILRSEIPPIDASCPFHLHALRSLI